MSWLSTAREKKSRAMGRVPASGGHAPRRTKSCTCSLRREDDRRMQETKRLCRDVLPDQAIGMQRTGTP